MRAKTRGFAAARPGILSCAARAKNVTFPSGAVRSDASDIFSEKKPVGTSFHVLVMQAHARTGPSTVWNHEKKRDKVPWALEQVSLYNKCMVLFAALSTLTLTASILLPRAPIASPARARSPVSSAADFFPAAEVDAEAIKRALDSQDRMAEEKGILRGLRSSEPSVAADHLAC